jgi:hypothetical protein
LISRSPSGIYSLAVKFLPWEISWTRQEHPYSKRVVGVFLCLNYIN